EFIIRLAAEKCRIRIVGFPLVGVEQLRFDVADGREIRIVHALPRGRHQAKGECAFQLIGDRRKHLGVTESWILGRIAVAAESGAEIDQIMTNEMNSLLFDNSVETVTRFWVRVIEPRRKHVQSSQITTIFMWDDIVGVIPSSSLKPKWADAVAFNRET